MIDFGYGAAQYPGETWEREINGWTFVFTKARDKEGVFLYNCQCLPQFAKFIARKFQDF
jgi:hypothetical protein